MNREDIIRMARVAGCRDNGEEFRFVKFRYLERFAALVAAAEREALLPMLSFAENAFMTGFKDGVIHEREECAKVCDRFQERDVGMQPAECAGAIRARGQS